MDDNISNANNTQQVNFNLTERIIHKVWQTTHGSKNKLDKEYKKLEKTIKTQFDVLNSKYLEAWNLLHKIANTINQSLVIKKYQIGGKDFDLYEQEKKLLNVKMEIFYEVENKVDLTKEELEIMMGRALEQISKIYNELIELKNNHQEFEKIEIENQKNKIEKEINKKYKNSKKKAKRKITTNQIMIIIFSILTLVCITLLGLILVFRYF